MLLRKPRERIRAAAKENGGWSASVSSVTYSQNGMSLNPSFSMGYSGSNFMKTGPFLASADDSPRGYMLWPPIIVRAPYRLQSSAYSWMANSRAGLASSKGVTIDNSWQATGHYLFGDGSAANIGPKTTNSLLNSPEFLKAHKGIISGQSNTSGTFNVNMTKRVFHVGRTNVSYTIDPSGKSVTYKLYDGDGFWDPDFIDEKFLGPHSPYFKPDGPGPNLERFGGTPYPYVPTIITFPF